MLRWRFGSGVVLGLVLGIPLGAILVSLLAPPPDQNARLDFEVRELTRKLEAANEARVRADRQLEEFQKLADQMTRSFENLERRFRELEAQLQEAEHPSSPATPTVAAPDPNG